MAESAYIGLTPEGHWALFATGDEPRLLALGEPFEPGPAIQMAVDALAAWAEHNGLEIVTPPHAAATVALEDLIEPALYDEVLGAGAQGGL